MPRYIPLGGDITLTYSEMITALQLSLPPTDSAYRCRLLLLPNRVFLLLASVLLPFSPRAFEAVFRMCANLSGFTAVHELLGIPPQSFPFKPIT